MLDARSKLIGKDIGGVLFEPIDFEREFALASQINFEEPLLKARIHQLGFGSPSKQPQNNDGGGGGAFGSSSPVNCVRNLIHEFNKVKMSPKKSLEKHERRPPPQYAAPSIPTPQSRIQNFSSIAEMFEKEIIRDEGLYQPSQQVFLPPQPSLAQLLTHSSRVIHNPIPFAAGESFPYSKPAAYGPPMRGMNLSGMLTTPEIPRREFIGNDMTRTKAKGQRKTWIKRPSVLKKGDWLCANPECSNINFSKRNMCNLCGAEKPRVPVDLIRALCKQYRSKLECYHCLKKIIEGEDSHEGQHAHFAEIKRNYQAILSEDGDLRPLLMEDDTPKQQRYTAYPQHAQRQYDVGYLQHYG
eukprot:TRINITY_DN1073_c0_g3_i1.p1 TRINITY_DN1073_c0_g3~~TRINITY_DN1073_c0_g3_i1.p1  ORF type:complete len:355 (-),score=70.32 TRINITY_DN1073_c0_g3_i1:120-1184(-)